MTKMIENSPFDRAPGLSRGGPSVVLPGEHDGIGAPGAAPTRCNRSVQPALFECA